MFEIKYFKQKYTSQSGPPITTVFLDSFASFNACLKYSSNFFLFSISFVVLFLHTSSRWDMISMQFDNDDNIADVVACPERN